MLEQEKNEVEVTSVTPQTPPKSQSQLYAENSNGFNGCNNLVTLAHQSLKKATPKIPAT